MNRDVKDRCSVSATVNSAMTYANMARRYGKMNMFIGALCLGMMYLLSMLLSL